MPEVSSTHHSNATPVSRTVFFDGILIDLQKLNQITVSVDKKIASLGPGGRCHDVFAALKPYDVSVIEGRISNVEVAGVILEGLSFTKS